MFISLLAILYVHLKNQGWSDEQISAWFNGRFPVASGAAPTL